MQTVPKIISNCFKNNTRKDPEIFQTTSKTDKGSLNFFQTTYFKNKTQMISQIFQIASRIILTKIPQILQITSKLKQKGFRDFFKLLQNHAQGILKIPSNYFKSKAKGVPEVFLNYLLQKPGTRDLRDFFKLLQKQNTKGPPDSFRLFLKQDKIQLFQN